MFTDIHSRDGPIVSHWTFRIRSTVTGTSKVFWIEELVISVVFTTYRSDSCRIVDLISSKIRCRGISGSLVTRLLIGCATGALPMTPRPVGNRVTLVGPWSETHISSSSTSIIPCSRRFGCCTWTSTSSVSREAVRNVVASMTPVFECSMLLH